MKKLFFVLLLCVSFCSESFAQQPTQGSYIYIDWGRPSNKCAGFGICDIKVNMTIGQLVTIFVAPMLSNVMIVFDRQYYDNHKGQFVDGNIVLEEDYLFNPKTAAELKLPAGYKIRAGKYKIVFDKLTNTYNCTF